MKATKATFFTLLTLCFVHILSANKPSELSQGIFCEGCIATVKELLKKVNKKTGESHEIKVVDAMEDICNLQNFGAYEYSPPKTGQACKYLIENYDENIEAIFISETENLEQKICYELTKACEGVDRSKKEKEDLEVNFNDRKQTVTRGPASSQNNEPETVQFNINDKDAAANLVKKINEAVNNGQQNKIDEDEDMEEKEDSAEDIENLTDKDKTEL